MSDLEHLREFVPPPFDPSEYKRRLRRIRDRMKSSEIDVMVVSSPENMYYISGYQTTGYYSYQNLFIPLDGEPILFVRQLEESNKIRTWIKRSATYGDSDIPTEVASKTLRELGFENSTIGVEKSTRKNSNITISEFEQLQRLLPDAKFVDSKGVVEASRLIKSEKELKLIRKAARIAEKGMQAGIDALEEGVNENDVAAEIYHALVKNGSEYCATHPYVQGVPIQHATFENRQIRKGPVSLELGATVKRYHCAMIRTVSIGKPSDTIVRGVETSRKALETAISFIKQDRTSEQVHNTFQNVIKEAGFAEAHTFRSGYSIGIAFPPSWSEGHIMDLKEGDKTLLKANMTFHLTGADLFNPGKYHVGISETVVVTKDGCESLIDFPQELFIK
jgi:Xaa-Pro dipeptidase